MDSVHSSDTNGGDSFCVLIEDDCWQPPGWKEGLERPNARLHGTGSEQPRATGCAPGARTSSLSCVHLFVQESHYHISLYFCAKGL